MSWTRAQSDKEAKRRQLRQELDDLLAVLQREAQLCFAVEEQQSDSSHSTSTEQYETFRSAYKALYRTLKAPESLAEEQLYTWQREETALLQAAKSITHQTIELFQELNKTPLTDPVQERTRKARAIEQYHEKHQADSAVAAGFKAFARAITIFCSAAIGFLIGAVVGAVAGFAIGTGVTGSPVPGLLAAAPGATTGGIVGVITGGLLGGCLPGLKPTLVGEKIMREKALAVSNNLATLFPRPVVAKPVARQSAVSYGSHRADYYAALKM